MRASQQQQAGRSAAQQEQAAPAREGGAQLWKEVIAPALASHAAVAAHGAAEAPGAAAGAASGTVQASLPSPVEPRCLAATQVLGPHLHAHKGDDAMQ